MSKKIISIMCKCTSQSLNLRNVVNTMISFEFAHAIKHSYIGRRNVKNTHSISKKVILYLHNCNHRRIVKIRTAKCYLINL